MQRSIAQAPDRESSALETGAEDPEQFGGARRIARPLEAVTERVIRRRQADRNARYPARPEVWPGGARPPQHEREARASVAGAGLRPCRHDGPHARVLVGEAVDDQRAVEAEVTFRVQQ